MAGPQVIKARGFAVINNSGKVLSLWGIDRDDPFFMMQDEYEKRKLTLGLAEDFSGLAITDWGKKSRITIAIEDDPITGIIIGDENGKPRMSLGVYDGKPTLQFRDTDNKLRTILTLKKGWSGLALFDTKEELIWSAPSFSK